MLGVILDIILIVLKVIGILLLSILGLLIVLLSIVLFVPVRYKSLGEFDKGDKGLEYQIVAKVTWLLHIVSIKFQRNGNKNFLSFKIFGIEMLNREKKRSKRKKKKTKKQKNIKSNKGNLSEEKKPVTKETNVSKDIVENIELKSEASNKKSSVQPVDNAKNKNSTNQESTKTKLKDKLNALICKIKSIFVKIKNINNAKNSFIEYLKRDNSRKSIKEIKRIIFKLIKHILPRKLKATVGFGFENPATTGSVLGYASIFYGIYGENLELEPDFDKQVLYGKYALKGHIRMFTVLLVAWKLYRNKWIREFITFSKETVKDL